MKEKIDPKRIIKKWNTAINTEFWPSYTDGTLFKLCTDILRLRSAVGISVPETQIPGIDKQTYHISYNGPSRFNRRATVWIEEFAESRENSSLIEITRQKPRGREKFEVVTFDRSPLSEQERAVLIKDLWVAFRDTFRFPQG